MKIMKNLISRVWIVAKVTCAAGLILAACESTGLAHGLPQDVPEIDPASFTNAIILLGGGFAILRSRVRR
ncbi:MAG TPA: hypothetical protein VG826_32465 [Pirellulales bacterium]|nr:hypothetical protein [Pirellulales bacterium]